MQSVLTLVAPRAAAPGLDDAIVTEVVGRLNAQGGQAGEPRWLSPGRAADVPFGGRDPAAAEAAARELVAGRPYDLLAGAAAGRRKRLLVADMDSTIVTTETIDELAAAAGCRDAIAAITARAMRGELDFADALRERVAMMQGLDAAALERTLAATEVTPGAAELVATMRRSGAATALVSGGFTFFTETIRERLGFDHAAGNTLGLENGRLTGTVAEPILGREAKLDMLIELTARYGLERGETLAIGDGANDLPMIRAAGLGVAFRGKPVLAKAAAARIDHTDLRTVLYFQGYADDEIVEAPRSAQP